MKTVHYEGFMFWRACMELAVLWLFLDIYRAPRWLWIALLCFAIVNLGHRTIVLWRMTRQ